jgi:hypothetical protein
MADTYRIVSICVASLKVAKVSAALSLLIAQLLGNCNVEFYQFQIWIWIWKDQNWYFEICERNKTEIVHREIEQTILDTYAGKQLS